MKIIVEFELKKNAGPRRDLPEISAGLAEMLSELLTESADSVYTYAHGIGSSTEYEITEFHVLNGTFGAALGGARQAQE